LKRSHTFEEAIMPDYASITALVGASFAGGIVAGFAGFAFSAVAGAVLLHFFAPSLTIPLMMLCSILAQVGSIVYLRKTLQWSQSLPLLMGGVFGVPVALSVFYLIDADVFRRGFGAFLVAYSAYMLLRPKLVLVHGGSLSNAAVGFAGGVVGGLTAMPGALPTIWCDLRGAGKEVQRGVVQPFITAMQGLAVLLFLARPERLPDELLVNLMVSLPGLALGTFVGLKLFGKVNETIFRRAVLVLLLISGLILTV
jgi:uncharacterized membrane protein YfcA